MRRETTIVRNVKNLHENHDGTGVIKRFHHKVEAIGELQEITTSLPPSLPMEITIGSTTFVVNGFFKPTGKTISEKLYSIMEKYVEYQGHITVEKSVENSNTMRYNDIIPKESLTVGNLRRIGL